MRVTVVGCGKVGKTIVGSLVSEGHEVVAMDNNPAVVEDVTNVYDVIGYCGMATDCDALLEAGVDKTDVFIAVTDSDEMNMLSCLIAKSIGAGNTVARIRDRSYNDNNLGFLQQQLELSMSINPEFYAAQDIYNVLKLPSAVHIETFSTRNFEVVELIVREDSPLCDVKIMDLRKNNRVNFLICAVQRDDDLYIPDGNFEIKSGDMLALTAAPTEILKLLRHLKLAKKQAKNVMILGASKTAYYLSKMLLNSGTSVTIIDKDPVVCKEICEALPGANIILGDGAQQDLLHEEGLGSVDAFISLTGMDEENILISYYAQSQEVPKVVTKVNRDEFIPMAKRLGLDTIISPRRVVSNTLVRYTRALQNTVGCNVEKMYKIMDGKAEALMFKASQDFKYVDIPLKDIHFKKNILIAGIIRNRKAIIPNGFDVFLPGDKVIVIASGHILYDLADIIE